MIEFSNLTPCHRSGTWVQGRCLDHGWCRETDAAVGQVDHSLILSRSLYHFRMTWISEFLHYLSTVWAEQCGLIRSIVTVHLVATSIHLLWFSFQFELDCITLISVGIWFVMHCIEFHQVSLEFDPIAILFNLNPIAKSRSFYNTLYCNCTPFLCIPFPMPLDLYLYIMYCNLFLCNAFSVSPDLYLWHTMPSHWNFLLRHTLLPPTLHLRFNQLSSHPRASW